MITRFPAIVLLSLSLTMGTHLSAQVKTDWENPASSAKSGLKTGGWADRIQRYGHGFSEPNDFTPEEYDYIAKNYTIFTVEKRHDCGY